MTAFAYMKLIVFLVAVFFSNVQSYKVKLYYIELCNTSIAEFSMAVLELKSEKLRSK